MKMVVGRRKEKGCFHCGIQSCTAFVHRGQARDADRLKEAKRCTRAFQGTSSDGGIYSCGYCCNSFFICRPCCLAFLDAIPTSVASVTLACKSVFPHYLEQYISDFAPGDFVELPDGVPCMSCSVVRASLQGVVTIDYDANDNGVVRPSERASPRTVTKNRVQMTKHEKLITLRNHVSMEQTGRIQSLAGCLFFWPHFVIMRNYTGRYTTHSMCAQVKTSARPGEEGVYHCVISESMASEIDMGKFFRSKKISTKKGTKRSIHRLPEGDREGYVEEEMLVEWHCYGTPETTDKDGYRLHGSHPTVDMIMKATLVEVDFDSGVDVFSLLLEPRLSNNDLFLGAQVYLKPRFKGVPTNDGLYFSLSKRASHSGFVAERKGGALGRCNPTDKAFLNFISKKGLTPRLNRSCLIIIVNSMQRCGFYVLYVTPYERSRRVVSWWYDTPRYGGSEVLTRRQTTRFPLFDTFPFCRVQTAILCDQYNETNSPKIMTVAVSSVLGEWNAAKLAAGSEASPVSIAHELAIRSTHSLIEYSCGFHLDVSGQHGTDDIENKITLVCLQKSGTADGSVGRGGCGPHLYTYAVMDWTPKTRTHRL